MHVTMKLYASLGAYLPANAERNEAKVEVGEGTTILELLDPNRFKLGRQLLSGVDADALETAAEGAGYRTLQAWGERLAAEGRTSPTELFRVLGRRRLKSSPSQG